MKKTIIIVMPLIIFLYGCIPKPITTLSQNSGQKKVTRKKPKPISNRYFFGKTDADLLLDSILHMDIPILETEKRGLQSAPVVIASLEHPAESEYPQFPVEHGPIKTFVEDSLTEKLTHQGIEVVERDLDILTRLYHEVGKNYLISITPDYGLDKSQGGKNSNVPADKKYFKPPANLLYIYYPYIGKVPLQSKAPLTSAGYILSFRVLECGMTYLPIKGSTVSTESENPTTSNSNKVKRIAVTKLHLRLTNKRGVTQWAAVISGEASEINNLKDLPYAKSPYLQFNGFNNPTEKIDFEAFQGKVTTNKPNSSELLKPKGKVKKIIEKVYQ